jgi:hypothetical protein
MELKRRGRVAAVAMAALFLCCGIAGAQMSIPPDLPKAQPPSSLPAPAPAKNENEYYRDSYTMPGGVAQSVEQPERPDGGTSSSDLFYL